MNNNKENMYWVVGGLLVLGIIAFFVFAGNDKEANDIAGNDANDIAQEQLDNNSADEDVEGELDTTGQVDVATSPAASLTYQQALDKYKGTRLQLDKTCQASPNNMTFKNGATMMLDNRSPETRTVKVGSTYTIKPYGFRIITLSASTFPTTYLVDCNGSQNVATILVQK